MDPDIFDVPAFLFTKMTGTSTALNPFFIAVYFISIWNPYPFIFTLSRSMAYKTLLE